MDSETPSSRVSDQQLPPGRVVGVFFAGLILASVLCRHFFSLPEGQFFANHDNDGYGLRLIEFRDCLSNGYLFPQWCSHFRGGLGSPFFNFYQSGYFYAASLVPASSPLNWQLGTPLVLFAAYGFACIFMLIRKSSGGESAFVAAVALLAAPYSQTNLYLRGDLSEFSAMMCVPACLLALNFWWNHGGIRSVLGIGFSAAPVVCLHPAIGLITCGLVLLVVVAKTLRDVSIRTFLSGVGGLLAAAGLSAFYWLPLFAHMNLVAADQAWDGTSFDGYYHYSQHLNSLRSFLDTSKTETPIPIKLGLPALVGVTLTVILHAVRRKHVTSILRLHVVGLLVILCGGLFLMTPASLWLWDHLPLLNRIQFPWRILTLVSISLACLIGTAFGHIGHATVRRLLCGVMLLVLSMPLLSLRAPERFPDKYPQDAAEIAERFFAPDIANEWLPKGAKAFAAENVTRNPEVVEGAGDCTVSDFVLSQNALTYSISATAPSVVRLPHYAFPLGWKADVRTRQEAVSSPNAELAADADGMMLVKLDAPLEGTVTVRWHTTRIKLIGAAVSAAALLAALIVLWRAKPEQEASATKSDLQTSASA